MKRKRRLIRTRKKEVPFDYPTPKVVARGMSVKANEKAGSGSKFEGIPKSARGVKADGNKQDWKDRVVEAKKAKKSEEQAKQEREKQQEQQKWDSVPAWKRRLIEQKEKEAEEKAKPQKVAELKKKELQEKISAMAPWRRELFIKKHGLEGEFEI